MPEPDRKKTNPSCLSTGPDRTHRDGRGDNGASASRSTTVPSEGRTFQATERHRWSRTGRTGKQAENSVGVTVGPATDGVNRALDGIIILAD